jgi:hypothetical protein
MYSFGLACCEHGILAVGYIRMQELKSEVVHADRIGFGWYAMSGPFILYNIKPDSSVVATWVDAGAEISVMVQFSA